MRQESRPRIPRELCHLRADLLEDLAFGAKVLDPFSWIASWRG
jgi:hypothetical protein